ncbi:indolepyruvate ferredoxin oxidoreductase family protein [Breoghania sp. L-A4]|uniref:indolepyruvate ferredoxin oxidoreductase family protein n=1 Tax=Breoghania sp. L-A4 TaxID=2304600 RepID=UPI000E35B513|nr:indolepyruvate ferredoxin oxidoreductase family protein [Breoghania sp. L-A4]AXS41889.1 indolepyruvate ferredoxin oxidoreductase family protein [Breoghania sp. L-A4]
MPLKPVRLDDKFDLATDRVFVSGTQALVRLTLMQKARDQAAGLNTGGYVTGYRGSPLGGLDQQFARARGVLEPADIHFQPAINEDLAATALWGTQQVAMRGEGRVDGVFGIWYGKGPGVDRSGDAFRHANLAGTSPHGGVLALMGDDHTCESSTTAHQSEFAFVDAMMPVLNPAGVQEMLDFGLHGWALSRYAGIWAGLKCVKDNVESTASIDGSLNRVMPVLPDFAFPEGGPHIRVSDHPLTQEARLHELKLPAAMAYLAANALDQLVHTGGRNARVGIASTGKSWLDVQQALDSLGIDEVKAADLGLRLYKIGCSWPLEPQGFKRFAQGLDLIIVVEEKRSLIESQAREILYRTANAPVIVGKRDEEGQWLFPSKGALDANDIAVAIGERVTQFAPNEALQGRIGALREAQATLRATEDVAIRSPYFCAGCPHNSSTVIPEGSRAYAGIGCHYMAQFMDRNTEGYTQMGGEGANWVGEAPFSTRDHVFQNLGDGTYNHSGYLAVRAAAASKVNVTYKILFNDAVAMTGGQAHDGGLSVPQIAAQVAAEGANRVVIVSDEPDKYAAGTVWPEGTTIHHRSELIPVEKELAKVPGLSVLIYDQTCAAEKRRRRKRGTFPDPDKRVVINEQVCEGCGDCGVQSNCVAIQPMETEFGRKRQIDQSSCNKDFSCLNGFCPSFVTVHGGTLKKSAGVGEGADVSGLVAPELPELDGVYNILLTGVGGTGVVTIGAVLGMAAHLEGKGIGIIDMAGLAQKGGAVTSHIRIAERPEDISSIRIAAGAADLVLGCDMVVAGSAKVLAAADPMRSTIVVNTHETYPGDFTRDADFTLPSRRLIKEIEARGRVGRSRFIEATKIATGLMGDSIAANMFMLGYAWQLGAVPLAAETIEQAIELNGVAVAMNRDAFRWGRKAAANPDSVEAGRAVSAADLEHRRPSESLEEVIARRTAFLVDYQNASYAQDFSSRVALVRAAEERVAPGSTELAETVARNLFKLMAIKDEYEVARLFSDGSFQRQLKTQFEDWKKLEFHLAPPIMAKRDPETGKLKKQVFGPWMMRAFGWLAACRGLRGSWADPFARTGERRMEKALMADYMAVVDEIAGALNAGNRKEAALLAAWPARIRGYGHVREQAVKRSASDRAALLQAFRTASGVREAAE